MLKFRGVLWGLVLVALGGILATNAAGITDIDIFFDGWWTLFVIIPSVINLITRKPKVSNIITLLIGVLLLLAAQDVISYTLLAKLFWPVILVLIGLKILFRTFSKSRSIHERVQENVEAHRDHLENGEKNPDGFQEFWATFGNQTVDSFGKQFKNGSADAVFGKLIIDFSKAKIVDNATLKASAVFGNVKIILPENVKVEVSTSSIFGSVANNHEPKSTAKTTIYIDASSVFGGVEIK